MSKTQIFIEKARAKHGDRYSYDRVVYVGARDKVTITCKKHGDFEQTPNSHLNGSGCVKCGLEEMAAKNTRKAKNSFIERARAVHGDMYNYSKAVYTRSHDKVIITCSKHGDFEQTPSNHLKGYGCAKCSGKHRYSTREWVQEAIAVHGDSYSYDRVVYVRNNDKVIITCKKHGDFEQAPNKHLSGRGCAKCSGNHNYSTDEWVQEAIGVHGDCYGYDRAVYIRNKDKVIITCKKHGDFEQESASHLSGKGCAKCGKESMAIKISQEAKDNFIERSRAVHGDRYDYGRVVYVRAHDKVIIICANHGDFEQRPNDHLKGNGCPSCPRRYDHPANLYLMRNGLGKVKVGYSIDVDARISKLNRDAPFEAELLEMWTLPDTPTVRKIEGKVHRKLAKYHAGLSGFDGASEWFNVSHERAKKEINAILINYAILNHTIANQPQLSLF